MNGLLKAALATVVSTMLIVAPVFVALVRMDDSLGWKDAMKLYGACTLFVVWMVGMLALVEVVL